MNAVGAILTIAGAILSIVGFSTFLQGFIEFGSMDPFDGAGEFNKAFNGMLMLAPGSLMLFIGIYLLYIANFRRVVGYFADEAAPAVSTVTGAMTEGARRAGGIPIAVSQGSSREAIKVKCRSCGFLNDEEDEFCGKCGKRL